MTNDYEAQLGDEVKDIITGFHGIATAKTTFLNGCVRVSVTPPVDNDGKYVDDRWFDVEQIEVVQRGKVNPKPALPTATSNGGDRNDCPSR
jgi:hypothetical protein